MTSVATDSKLCEHCLTIKPAAAFRRRSSSNAARFNQCRDCHNRAERARRAHQKTLHDRRKMASFLTQVKNEQDYDRLELLSRVMLDEFGGVQGFVNAWSDYYQRAMERGGFGALRCIESVLRLMQYCEEKVPDACQLSDAELQEAMIEQTKAIIQDQPELAVAAAAELGWTVIPPSSPTSSNPQA